MTHIIKILIPVMLLALAACSNENSSAEDGGTLEVYTTVFPLKSFAEQIGGDTVDVETIYPEGVDIHTYEPTQKDMVGFAEGDLFIYTTDEFDPVANTIKNAVDGHTEFLPAAADISDEELLEYDHEHGHEVDDDHGHGEHEEHGHEEHDHDHGSTDPHIWLDPVFSQSMAEVIKDKLTELNPEEASMYEENYEALISDLEEINQELAVATEETGRDTVYISHESIGYLADRYGFEQAAINGLNNEEPSQQELMSIVDDIESHNIDYILYEQNITSRITDTIQNSTDTEPLEFHNLEVLTADDPDDATYQSIMRENISVLEQALNE
ncbi:metal ABC transporter solute-binding protein, Zn/Mn family [Salinicoccus kekensis]|uniref:Zinc transport system substrate-binding protein n=1 Tax=Salinicoccus kekensis TaxID=714307 RepID=A0A285UK06_9STAP|nr:zinc ABC transporter substrate-binding protein [Salinicoccus kekensis]SOC40936.1 zinc transport system substrate-binding protein [Salinicoccus kekensis]